MFENILTVCFINLVEEKTLSHSQRMLNAIATPGVAQHGVVRAVRTSRSYATGAPLGEQMHALRLRKTRFLRTRCETVKKN